MLLRCTIGCLVLAAAVPAVPWRLVEAWLASAAGGSTREAMLGAALATAATAGPAAAERDGASQGPRATHALGYYDATRRRVVLVAGAGTPRAGERDRLWSWTGTRWLPGSTDGPPARGNASVAYDGRRGRAVLTGGAHQTASDAGHEVLGDTWEGGADGWRRVPGADVPPRDHHATVYDARGGAVLLFGGIPADRTAPWPGESWELRDGRWVRVDTAGPAPRARTALAYDERRRQVVLFGGVGAAPAPEADQPFFGDTWVRDAGGWRRVAAEGGPRGRYAHGMVFDARAGVVLLYGGAAAHRGAPLGDMWQWDGRRWTEIPLRGPTPGHRYQPVMVHDRARGTTILHGGGVAGDDDSWEWDGRRWTVRRTP